MIEPKNINYCATVVKLEKFVPLLKGEGGKQNCDNVKAAIIFGNSVIVSKDTEPGSIGLFFPVETALSEDFLRNNNLYNKSDLNLDNTKKGYFESHGRIKAVKFRGHKSEGFWIPIESLNYIPNLEDPKLGDQFDQIGDDVICFKYVPKTNRSTKVGVPGQKKQKKPQDRIVNGQFAFHVDTAQLKRNIHRLHPKNLITISDKWHGTSAIYANILVQRELNWLERLLKKWNWIQIQETEYGFVTSSRRVIKEVTGKVHTNTQHFYDVDIWSKVGEEIKDLIPKGYTVYGEIVGYVNDHKMIQKGYHYGCQPGTHQFLVYRVTFTNPDGKVIELSHKQLTEFCKKVGLETVKCLYYGFAKDFGSIRTKILANKLLEGRMPEESLENWQQYFLEDLQKQYVYDQMCSYNNNEVPAEGIVLKVETTFEPEVYKLKSFKFLEWETKELDKGEVDLETEQSEVENV
jgi:hypothetical protein